MVYWNMWLYTNGILEHVAVNNGILEHVAVNNGILIDEQKLETNVKTVCILVN